MLEKRNKIVFTVILIIFSCLCTRFLYLQVYSGKNLFKAAASQRTASSEIEPLRGDLLDRNDIRFTNRSTKFIAVIKPLLLRGRDEEIRKVSDILGLDFYKLKREIGFKSEPILEEVSEETKNLLTELSDPGISIINSLSRYDKNSVAKHVLGYLNKVDKVGEAGIEKYYNNILHMGEDESVGAVKDAKNNLIKGIGYTINKSGDTSAKLNVKLTLDYHIQQIVEKSMEKNRITGAVVVEDVCTGDIVAMASKPDFDQNDVGRYLNSTGNELFNRAVASYNIGSIFKIVDAAAILQSREHSEEIFYCPGYAKIGNMEFKCTSYSKGGHGWVNLDEAFAYSCNTYFINSGIKLGSEILLGTAEKFGLGSYTGINRQGVDESSGKLPGINKKYTTGDVANIAIGQGDVLATPLQVADMVATVANGGIKNQVNLVDSIVDGEGNEIKKIRVKKGERILPKEVADRIKFLMEEVTVRGTGTNASLKEYGGAGGKTGSAETGQYIDGNKVVHAWFAGYFPLRDPKYSIAVFVENGKNGGQTAAPVFEEIAEEIMKKGY
ncbi:MAG: penicillin-binding transpeptidase domain-containing protein [Clostridiales bacterium]|jgi:peptidoglycan glycosyltransferase/penicillin-binding protein 2|nr:penicillin-binding transpeptidase domain-containing protein [Eubacteriales bacterium]MDH7564889.1 penicillin-binding transpeptidase domain-containing protein [Clostridiales bacterium]